ncbi:MAG: single-stranded-DNA-specific exonuclease RecJ [Patescibacteria group bacterium]|jgi:single-stranded-DNA-specific exonuclease
MKKKWQIAPEISDEIIKKYPEHNRVILQLLFNRGLNSGEEMEEFLNDGYEKLHDPAEFNDMAAAVPLIIRHIKEKNKILVYGDYDADGVTASAVMTETLNTLKADTGVYIPFRTTEGYGLNKGALEEAKNNGVKLVITVDTGIRNAAEVRYAKELGLDVIVTDHHSAPEEKKAWPDCLIINANLPEEKYPFKSLAGVGTAFKLASAVIAASSLSGEDKEKLKERILDLVAIGTVTDMVILRGENRILVKKGLEVLNKNRRVGLKELINISQINNGRTLDSWNIGFQLGPRLNAAGRLDHANTAYELLITRDSKEAKALAGSLNGRNIERQMITEKITEEIIADLEVDSDRASKKIIIAVADKGIEKEAWNEGVVGLIAGRIAERYYLPALVITVGQGGEWKGSGRSIEEFNLIHAVERCSQYLDKYGGHPAACGFSFKKENLEGFKKMMEAIAESELGKLNLRPKIKVDAEIDLSEINEEFIKELEKFAPFGAGNEKPKFVSKGITVMDIMRMGADNQHLKLRLKSENSGLINAIGFGQAAERKDLRIGDKINLVYYPEINEYNGRREAQLKIIDIKSRNS